MRFITALVLACALAPLHASAQATQPAQQGAATRVPFVVERTYWVRPGKELQFIAMFEKNSVPKLRARMKEGHVLWMRLARPQFNASNDQWDLRLTVAWRDADSAIERINLANAQQARDTQRLALEEQIMEELIVDRSDIPVQEWDVGGTGN